MTATAPHDLDPGHRPVPAAPGATPPAAPPRWWTLDGPEPDKRLDVVLEVYRQGAENARMYANSRFSNLSAFLTYVSLITAGIAVLIGSTGSDGPPEALVAGGCLALATMGLLIAGLFFQLEFRHHHWWHYYEYRVIADIEKQLGFGQHPDPGGDDATHRRAIDKHRYGRFDPRGRASATRATYGIYVVSMAFFGLAIVVALAMLAGLVPLSAPG